MAVCCFCGKKCMDIHKIEDSDFVFCGKCGYTEWEIGKKIMDNDPDLQNTIESFRLKASDTDVFDAAIKHMKIIYTKKGEKLEEERKQVELKKKIAKEEETRAEQERIKAEQLRQESLKTLLERKHNFKMTTGYNFEGYRITKYIDICNSEYISGTGFLSDLMTSVSTSVGGQDSYNGVKLEFAKKHALEALKENALQMGADAIIGIDIDIMTLGGNIVISANGTAVTTEKLPE